VSEVRLSTEGLFSPLKEAGGSGETKQSFPVNSHAANVVDPRSARIRNYWLDSELLFRIRISVRDGELLSNIILIQN
jgi:hypothetical protein